MKKKILATVLFTVTIIGAFTVGKVQTNQTSIKEYIECDSVETFFVDINDELHVIANDGNEYIFTK